MSLLESRKTKFSKEKLNMHIRSQKRENSKVAIRSIEIESWLYESVMDMALLGHSKMIL